MEDWKNAGKILAIFSSGSVQAQLQFFTYVQDGQSTKDIKHLFSAHYDTVNAGPKLEKASYEKICRELGVDVSMVTFLTDNVKGESGSPSYVNHNTSISSLHVIAFDCAILTTDSPPIHIIRSSAQTQTIPNGDYRSRYIGDLPIYLSTAD